MLYLFRKRFPEIILFLCVSTIVLTASSRSSSLNAPVHRLELALAILYLLWLVAETPIAISSSQKTNDNTDQFSIYIYGTARVCTIAASGAFSSIWTVFTPTLLIVVPIFSAAVLFRLMSIRALGKFYSHKARITDDHRIVTGGPYRMIRHPAYLGMIVSHVAYVVLFFNIYSFLALVLLLIPSIIYRIKIEEAMLMVIPEYKKYALHHWRLIPYVW